MPKRDRSPESISPARQPEHPAEAPESLTDTLARIRREALARVTDQLNGRASASETPSVFGDIRKSVGKAVRERVESAG